MPVHGGKLAARALKEAGVEAIFTLSGGHIMPIYDGCIDEGIKIIDVRHEQAAVHAADAWARCNPGQIGVAARDQPPVLKQPVFEAHPDAPEKADPRSDLQQIVVPHGFPVPASRFGHHETEPASLHLPIAQARLPEELRAANLEIDQIVGMVDDRHLVSFTVANARRRDVFFQSPSVSNLARAATQKFLSVGTRSWPRASMTSR